LKQLLNFAPTTKVCGKKFIWPRTKRCGGQLHVLFNLLNYKLSESESHIYLLYLGKLWSNNIQIKVYNIGYHDKRDA